MFYILLAKLVNITYYEIKKNVITILYWWVRVLYNYFALICYYNYINLLEWNYMISTKQIITVSFRYSQKYFRIKSTTKIHNVHILWYIIIAI